MVNPKTDREERFTTSITEYFARKYNILMNKKERLSPILVYTDTFDLKKKVKQGKIYLPSCLCNKASLDKSFTTNPFNMRTLRSFKISDPEERYNRINQFMKRVVDKCSGILETYGLRV